MQFYPRNDTIQPFQRACALLLLAGGAAYAQPTLSVVRPDSPAYSNRPYVLEIEVRWPAEGPGYLVLPAEVPEVTWAQARVEALVVRTESRETVASQRVALTASTPGSYVLDPVSVPVLEAGDAALNVNALTPTLTLRSEALTLTVNPPPAGAPMALMAGGFLGALVSIAGSVLWLRRRSGRASPAGPAGVTREEEMRQALSQARRHQLDGLYYEFYRDLARAATLASRNGDGQELAARLEARAQEVGFKGALPTPDELNGAIREVERALTSEMEAQQV